MSRIVSIALVLVSGAASAGAQDASEKILGAWKTRVKFAGYDQTLAIKNENGKWTIDGTFQRDGMAVGAFFGANIKYAGGKLSYVSKYRKKPVESWGEDNPTLHIDGDAIVMSFVTDTGEKIVRTFDRMPGEPKVVAKNSDDAGKPKSDPTKTKLQLIVEEKFVGTWKMSGRIDEYWTVAPDGASFTVTGTFWKSGKEVGSAHGKEISYGKDSLTFRRVFDKKPDPKLGNSTICIFKATGAGVELIVGGGFKAKGEPLARAEAPKVVAKAAGKPDPKPATPKNDGKFMGTWIGAVPGGKDRLSLYIIKVKNDLVIEGFVIAPDNKPLAYFKEPKSNWDDEGKALLVTPSWLLKAPPLTEAATLALTLRSPGLRVEAAGAKAEDKVTVDLARAELLDAKQITMLKPPLPEKGKPAGFPGGKSTTFEVFKLPPDIPAAKPFAVLDPHQWVVAVDVSPDGKRVALGSVQPLKGDFTADIAVWEIEQQKQVWIRKKLVVGDNARVEKLTFSGDGKILAAKINSSEIVSPVRFFDAVTGQELKSPPPLKILVTCLAFHPTQRLLAIGTGGTGATQGTLALLDLSKGTTRWSAPQVYRYNIEGVVFSPTGTTIATWGLTKESKNHSVKLFDAANGKLIDEFTNPKGICDCVAFSPDGSLVAASFGQFKATEILVRDVAAKKETQHITDLFGASWHAHRLAFLPDNKTLAATSFDHHLHLFDVTSGQRVGIFPKAYHTEVANVFVVGDGTTLLTCTRSDGENGLEPSRLRFWKTSEAQTLPVGGAPK